MAPKWSVNGLGPLICIHPHFFITHYTPRPTPPPLSPPLWAQSIGRPGFLIAVAMLSFSLSFPPYFYTHDWGPVDSEGLKGWGERGRGGRLFSYICVLDWQCRFTPPPPPQCVSCSVCVAAWVLLCVCVYAMPWPPSATQSYTKLHNGSSELRPKAQCISNVQSVLLSCLWTREFNMIIGLRRFALISFCHLFYPCCVLVLR